MRDRDLRQWKALVWEHANREWRELSLEVVDELACHLAELHAAAIRDGASEADARQMALDTLNAASFVELSKRPRSRRGGGYMHDIRVAMRQLIATPVVTIVAVLSLALGIGANTAIFSLVDSLLLHPLPVKDPQRLALLQGGNIDSAGRSSFTPAIWEELRRRPQLFDSAFAWADGARFNIANGGVAEFVDGIWTTSGMFDTLGIATLNLGFDPARVLVVTMNAQSATLEPSQRMPIYERALDAVQALPGVERATLSPIVPVSGRMSANRFVVSDGVPLADNQRSAFRNQVTPGFFETYGQRLVSGRAFTGRDRDGAPRVAIVNEAFARQFLDGGNPVGHTVRVARAVTPEGDMEIVGLVSDAVYRRVRDPLPPTLYTPVAQTTVGAATTEYTMSVRAASESPAQLSRSIADAIGGVNRDLTLTFRPLAEQVNASLTQERLVAMLSGFFGALALLLASLGLYGVTSYAVTCQRTEIGIRMALGAAPGSVVRLVLSRVTMLVATGVVVGAGVSMWASQFVSTLLYGIEPRDPATLVGSAAVLAAGGALAGWLPAYRASRIDPAQVLRDS